MSHLPETLIFAILLTLIAGPLAAAFAPAEIAAVRRWWARQRLEHRVRRYSAAWHRDGTDLVFGYARLRATRTDGRIRTYPRHRLHGGRA